MKKMRKEKEKKSSSFELKKRRALERHTTIKMKRMRFRVTECDLEKKNFF
jgi:hypothetical protein